MEHEKVFRAYTHTLVVAAAVVVVVVVEDAVVVSVVVVVVLVPEIFPVTHNTNSFMLRRKHFLLI